MTDRRSRAPIRCADPGCVHLGAWHASKGMCPTHYRELAANTAAAVARATATPEPVTTPIDVARDLLGGQP